jgi:hypothetical protein
MMHNSPHIKSRWSLNKPIREDRTTYEGLVTCLGWYASDAHLVANMMSIILECHQVLKFNLPTQLTISCLFLRTYTKRIIQDLHLLSCRHARPNKTRVAFISSILVWSTYIVHKQMQRIVGKKGLKWTMHVRLVLWSCGLDTKFYVNLCGPIVDTCNSNDNVDWWIGLEIVSST